MIQAAMVWKRKELASSVNVRKTTAKMTALLIKGHKELSLETNVNLTHWPLGGLNKF